MIAARECTHKGWKIRSACWEHVGNDGKPGDTPQYCASGFAEHIDTDGVEGTWLTTYRQMVPSSKAIVFGDGEEAHSTIQGALRDRIDSLQMR